MLNIGPQFGNTDPLDNRRRIERQAKSSPASGSSESQRAQGQDSLSSGDITQEDIQKYVAILKDMDPTDLHRIEDFRQRIEDGSYSSDLDELIDPLLDFLSDDNEPA